MNAKGFGNHLGRFPFLKQAQRELHLFSVELARPPQVHASQFRRLTSPVFNQLAFKIGDAGEYCYNQFAAWGGGVGPVDGDTLRANTIYVKCSALVNRVYFWRPRDCR